MPTLSDPGERLVEAAAAAGHAVLVVPGPSAPAAALAVSGLSAVPHTFLGFLPARQGERERLLETLRERTRDARLVRGAAPPAASPSRPPRASSVRAAPASPAS